MIADLARAKHREFARHEDGDLQRVDVWSPNINIFVIPGGAGGAGDSYG